MIPESDYEYICTADFIPWKRLQGKTILITGATGLLGSTLTGALLYANEKRHLGLTVLALVRDEDRAIRRFAGVPVSTAPLRFVVGTVEEPPTIDGPVDYIIHAAAQTASEAFVHRPAETIQTAVLGTLHFLELAREKRAAGFLFTSSMEVYGHPPKGRKVVETDLCALSPLNVRNSYPVSKLQCESLCCAYAAEYGVPAVILRLAQTFGPGVHPEDGRVFAQFGRCIRERRDIVLHTKGETERSYLYTADAATAILTTLLKGQPGQAYNAADESTYCSIADMARKVAAANGIGLRFEPEDKAEHGYPEPVYMDLDTSRLRSLGWRTEGHGDKESLLWMYDQMIAGMAPGC